MRQLPRLDPVFHQQRLAEPAGRVDVVLDTDAYNEVDDQFAIAHALLSPGRIHLRAIHAAPFHNERSTGPADGMDKSFDEIVRLLGMLGRQPEGLVFRGSTGWLADEQTPQPSEAVDHLIALADAQPADRPLYVAAIGAITNVASALLAQPRLVEKLVVVWLGGHAYHWPDTREFNLRQDVAAARVVFDSGVPLVHFPCAGCVDRLATTVAELEATVGGAGRLADYLVESVRGYNVEGHPAWSKVLWDVVTTAWVVDPGSSSTYLRAAPIVTRDATWSFDPRRHPIRAVLEVRRDRIFGDLFAKLRGEPG